MLLYDFSLQLNVCSYLEIYTRLSSFLNQSHPAVFFSDPVFSISVKTAQPMNKTDKVCVRQQQLNCSLQISQINTAAVIYSHIFKT